MIELALLTLLISEHNYSHWDMSCSEWKQKRIEILSDKNLNSDAHEYLIDYFKTKVSGKCDAYIIGYSVQAVQRRFKSSHPYWREPAKADTLSRLDGGIDHKKWPKNFSTEER